MMILIMTTAMTMQILLFMMIIMTKLKSKGAGHNDFDDHVDLDDHIEKFQGDGLIKSAPGFSGLLGQVKTWGLDPDVD